MNSVYKPCQSAKLRNFINIAYIVATRGPSGPKKTKNGLLVVSVMISNTIDKKNLNYPGY